MGLYVYADEGLNLFKRIEGTSWGPYTSWVFVPGQNAGMITFLNQSQEGAVGSSGVYLDTVNNSLSGSFFCDTIGWSSIWVYSPVQLIPPGGDTTNITTPWKVTGLIWNDNAGWINLEALDASYSWVYFIPSSNSFSGYAWSDTIGFVDLGLWGSSPIGFVNSILSQVKVLWNIAGSKSFDTNYNIGTVFKSVTLTAYLNQIKKNISILTRSIQTAMINTSNTFIGAGNIKTINADVAYFKLDATNSGKYILMGSGSNNILTAKHIRTLIIEGGDLYINGDITRDLFVDKPRTIIVLKDAYWNGGNIYLHGSVKQIISSIIADGSIYSGFPTSAQGTLPTTSFLYNGTKEQITNLPANQLYVYGSIITRNTIGWAWETNSSNGTCPFTESNCNRDTAIKYDFNHFRSYDKSPERRAYKDNSLDNYSMIIDYDPRTLADPPPGLSE